MASCKEDGMKLTGFVGKRALVTGGNRGIGLGIAEGLYKAGAQVIIAGRNQELLDAAKEKMPNIETLKFDLRDWQETKAAVTSVLPVHFLINNAGAFINKKAIGEVEESDYDEIMTVNTKSIFNVSQVVANDLKARGLGGVIVNLSSICSKTPVNGISLYCISKYALGGLTACMALELGPHNIRVHSVNPTIVLGTDMSKQAAGDPALVEEITKVGKATPLGRWAQIDDVVSSVMFLLSDQAAYLDGMAMLVDGGLINGR